MPNSGAAAAVVKLIMVQTRYPLAPATKTRLIQQKEVLMHDRDRYSDETPVADAIEQDQDTALEPTAADRVVPPVEADASDWQEQHQDVVGVDDDRDEYRD
jgi:hypothetical protein